MKIDAKLAGALSALVGSATSEGHLSDFFWETAKGKTRDAWQDAFIDVLEELGPESKISLREAVNHIQGRYDDVKLP